MWVNVEQNSDDWFALRLGKITSSNFSKIMANNPKAFGDPAKKYAMKIAVESATKKRLEGFSNEYMERGHEYEPEAVRCYEEETLSKVSNGGFFHKGIIGDSPDGLVGDKGCIEVKTVVYNQHFKRLDKKGIDTAYKWQIQGHLSVGDRDWCDFISYCPEMPESKRLYVCRVYRDEEMIFDLQERLKEFTELVKKYKKLLK